MSSFVAVGAAVPVKEISSLTNEKDHHYFLYGFVCVGDFFDGRLGQF